MEWVLAIILLKPFIFISALWADMCWNNGNKIAKKQSLGKSLRDFSWKGMKSGEPAFIDKNNKTTPKGGKGGIFKKPFLTRPLVSLMSEGQQMINVVLLNKGSTWGAPWGKHVNNFN